MNRRRIIVDELEIAHINSSVFNNTEQPIPISYYESLSQAVLPSTGELKPLLLPPGFSMSVKFMFKRKDPNKNKFL